MSKDAFSDILSHQQILPGDRQSFCTDLRGKSVPAAVILLPKSTHEVSRIIKRCSARQFALIPQGGLSGLCGGALPSEQEHRPQVILSLKHLNKILEFCPLNRTITAQSGCVLETLQAVVGKKQLKLPLEIGSANRAQLGGLIATNAGGLSVLSHGTMRALTLALEVVLPNGHILPLTPPVHKNNAGYDIKSLFIGSEGTLGVITKASLLLRSKTKKLVYKALWCHDLSEALAVFHRFYQKNGHLLEIAEIFNDTIARLAHEEGEKDACLLPPAGKQWCLLIGTITETLFPKEFVSAPNLLKARLNFSYAQRRRGASIKHDIALPLSSLDPTIKRLTQRIISLTPQASIIIFGHLGDGSLHVNVYPQGLKAPTPLPTQETQHAITSMVEEEVTRAHGSFAAEHGIGQYKTTSLKNLTQAPYFSLMKALKTLLDPHNILNPGKVLPLETKP